jgi:tRNA modification GTPase
MDELWSAIDARARALLPLADATPLNQRQRDLAELAMVALERAGASTDELLQAEELRAALRAFHRITGKADVEAMLDSLFGRFCIGK